MATHAITESAARLLWQRLAAYAVVLGWSVLLVFTPLASRLELALLDWQQRVVAQVFPTHSVVDIVVVGIDEDTVRQFPEPIALWHRHLGTFLAGMAIGKPSVVGFDLALPDRSFDAVLPGADLLLMRGLIAARQQAGLVVGQLVDERGHMRPLHAPFHTVVGEGGTGLLLLPPDADQVVRRFDERLGDQGQPVATLVGQMARHLGLAVEPGLINYSLRPQPGYVALHRVNQWVQQGDAASLQRAFGGKPVLLGSVLPFEDRHLQPVNLAGWEPDNGRHVPGVLIHAQALRSLMSGGLVRELSWPWIMSLALACTLVWFVSLPLRGAVALAMVLCAALLTVGVLALQRGVYLAVAAPMLVGVTVLGGRWVLDSIFEMRERRRLRAAFTGYVSPPVMQEIIEGRLTDALGGQSRHVCILFADVRGFTTLSESMPAQDLVTLLNRYFEQVNQAIHDQGGTISCFMGDGIMAIFGAPKTAARPSTAAFDSARATLTALERLNSELLAEGKTPLAIGIGLHVGEAIVGHLGSKARHDYSAIGDTTNVASRIEGLTKELGYPIVCSQAVISELAQPDGFVDLGLQAIKGHSPVHVWGWRAP